MKCLVNSCPWRIDYCCYVIAVLLLPLASAIISTDSKTLASNLDRKADTIEGSGSYPQKTSTSKNDPQIRPDTEFNSSGASPDDEDGDVNEGSGEVEGSGSVPARGAVTTATNSTVLTSTSSTTTTLSTTNAKSRHQLDEERIMNIHEKSEPSQPQKTPTTSQPILLETRTTRTTASTTIRQTPPTVVTRPPPPTTPIYGSDSGEFEMLKPGILAAVSGGAVVGILMTILLVMFIIYRMRKKDEGSYSLDEPHAPPNYSYAYQKASTKEFYA